MDTALRSKLIRLAHAKPELRPQILPLLTKQAMKGYPAPAEGPQALAKFFQSFAKELNGPELLKALGVKASDVDQDIKKNHITFKVMHPDEKGAYSTFSVWFDSDGMPSLDGFIHGNRVRKSFAHLGQSADAVAKAITKYVSDTVAQGKKASVKKAHGAVALKNPAVMLYVIDPADNKSKFYEMEVVPQGRESSAMKTKDFSRAAGGWVLMKRWGRLTDRGGVTGRVDSMNEIYDSEQAAEYAMTAWKQQKMRSSGYQDVSRTKTYPIGLGSAGFGWGGQVACNYVPELKEMAGVVNKSKADLTAMAPTLTALARRESGMAKAISTLYVEAMAKLGALDTYLEGQLSSC